MASHSLTVFFPLLCLASYSSLRLTFGKHFDLLLNVTWFNAVPENVQRLNRKK
jgi:hypothetical protein